MEVVTVEISFQLECRQRLDGSWYGEAVPVVEKTSLTFVATRSSLRL